MGKITVKTTDYKQCRRPTRHCWREEQEIFNKERTVQPTGLRLYIPAFPSATSHWTDLVHHNLVTCYMLLNWVLQKSDLYTTNENQHTISRDTLTRLITDILPAGEYRTEPENAWPTMDVKASATTGSVTHRIFAGLFISTRFPYILVTNGKVTQ